MNRTGNIHSEGQLLLMAIPILIIAGFQVFWLRENYIKEKKNLEFRSSVVFKETVRRLQAKKLNLDKVFNDSTGKIRVEVMNDEPMPRFPGPTMVARPALALPILAVEATAQLETLVSSGRYQNSWVKLPPFSGFNSG